MRILVLTNLYPPHYLGGYELICWMVVNELRRRGHELEVLTSDHQVESMMARPEEPSVRRSLKIHGFYGHPWKNIFGLARLEAHNNRQLSECARRFCPDLVYVWNMGGLSKSMLLQLQRLGLPAVYYVSDHWIARGLKADVWLAWWNGPGKSLRHRWTRRMLEQSGTRQRWDAVAPTGPMEALRFPRVSFCSRALRELTEQAGFAVGHGAVIYAPVDLGRFAARRDPGGKMERLLFVGRLSPDKGVMTAVRAMALLKGRFSGELSIYGRGERAYEDELKRCVREELLPVRFASAGLEEMPRVYAEHDCLIFPSEWVEPFALTPLEAMASGLPVIGTTRGGSAELFRHRENALVFPAGDAAQLADRILEFCEDPELRRRCAAAGCCEARENYSVRAIVDEVERYLEETIRAPDEARVQ